MNDSSKRPLTIGGTDARRLTEGDGKRLWQEKKGLAEPEDLSKVLPVQMGIITEALNLKWFTQETGIGLRLKVGGSMERDWRHATLDALTLDGIPVEAKHVNAFSSMDKVVAKYYPQIQHYMEVTDSPYAYFSVFIGTMTWEHKQIWRDGFYIQSLLELEHRFWESLSEDSPPDWLEEDPGLPQVVVDKTLCADMSGNNEWAYHAVSYFDDAPAAKRFAEAKEKMKELLPAKAQAATGAGVTAYRTKAGVRFRNATEADEKAAIKIEDTI